MSENSAGTVASKVFLSYTANDRAQANKLRLLLSQSSDAEIFAADSLSAGEDWAQVLRLELEACDIFLLLLTPHALASTYVLHELGAAWGLGKNIVVVYTDRELIGNVPVALKPEQFVDLKRLENPDSVRHLLKGDALEVVA